MLSTSQQSRSQRIGITDQRVDFWHDRAWWGLLAAGLLLHGSVARADEKAKTKGDATTVKTVVSKDKSVEDSRLPSGFVTRVHVGDETRFGRDLGDALEQVSGVTVRRSAGFGRAAFASVRGGNSRQLAVSLNGMRVSAPAGLGFDVGSLSLSGIDAVDVYRGSAATVHGAGALTGALDLRTRLPRGDGKRISVSSLAGSFGTYGLLGRAQVSHEHYALRLDAGWQQSAGDFDFVDAQGTSHQRVGNDHRRLSASVAGRIDVGKHAIEPLVIYQQGGGGAPGPSEFQDHYKDATLDSSRLIAQLSWKKKNLAAGDWGALDAHALAGYQRRLTDYANPHALLGDTAVRDNSTLQSFEADADADAWLAFGDIAHASLTGRREVYDATHVTSDSSTTAATRHTAAAAASDELLLFGQALSLVGGVRFEYIADSGAGTTGARTWVPLIPSAGVIWRARKWLKFKANIAQTFRAPDFDELYLNMVGVRGNVALEPERALTVDAGARLGPEKGPANLELVYFRDAIEQSIYFVARTAYLFEAANLGAGTSQGVEATLRVQPGKRLDLTATYTLTDASLDAMAPGVQMPGQPVHQVAGRVTAELAGLGRLPDIPSLRVFARGRWRSRVWLDSFGNLSNPPFWTADVGAAVAPVEWVEVALNVRNVADNQRGADSLQRPLPGRAFYGSVKVEFGGIE